MFSGPTFALTFGGTGAPVGMFLITGSGLKAKLLPLMFIAPTLIGPWICGPPCPVRKKVELGRHQRDPCQMIPWAFQLIALLELLRSVARVSMSLLPVLPCQFEYVQLVFCAQMLMLFVERLICPAAMITPTPLYVID